MTLNAAETKALGLVAANALYRSGVRKATLANLAAKGLVTISHREVTEWYRPQGYCSREPRSRVRIVADVRITDAGRAALNGAA